MRSLTHEQLAFSTTVSLFVDRSGCSLRFSHLEFNKFVISDGCRSQNDWYWRRDLNF